jgi:probable addiction module antidote protein
MALKTTVWDAADYLTDKESIAAYLDAVLEDGDPELIKAALCDIARAKGMTEIAEKPDSQINGLLHESFLTCQNTKYRKAKTKALRRQFRY